LVTATEVVLLLAPSHNKTPATPCRFHLTRKPAWPLVVGCSEGTGTVV
jgi:hypothetical protein